MDKFSGARGPDGRPSSCEGMTKLLSQVVRDLRAAHMQQSNQTSPEPIARGGTAEEEDAMEMLRAAAVRYI